MRIKRYVLRENVNSDDLDKLKFKSGSWQIAEKDKLVMSKCIPLFDSIELHITIPLEKEFDDFDDILVLDNDFCQPYTPFYGENYGREIEGFKFLERVIERYNQAMDGLGIFEEQQPKFMFHGGDSID